MEVIYEDNHIIAVDKNCREIVQGDKTGDQPLSERLKLWLKEKYNKPGNVFVGVTHRLDRPEMVIFVNNSKEEDELVNWLVRNEKQNKSYAYDTERPNAKKAILHYKVIARSEKYYLLEIDLKTGRHHQIRCQLAKMGCPIKGDLKYGADRSNPDGGISLHARKAAFIHPVSKLPIEIIAPAPDDNLWKAISSGL